MPSLGAGGDPIARPLAGIEDVRLAVLETDGSISVIPRDGDTPASNRPPSDERTT